MRERGISTLGGILVAALAGMITASVLADWVIVDVQVPEPDAVHITLPFPLVLGRLATWCIPDETVEDAAVPEELRQQREFVVTAVRALAEAPDTTLVRVDAPDAQVEVSKRGDNLHIAVHADDARVHCTVPLDGVLEALEGWDWESFQPGLVVDLLAAADHGDLVNVSLDDGTHVAIRMW